MARVLDFASEISRIFEQYQAIHQQVFRFSVRGLLGASSTNGRIGHAERGQRLKELAMQLRDRRQAVRDLEDAELTRRSKEEVRSVLLDYADALEESITGLQAICRNFQYESEGLDGYTRYTESEFRSDKVRYDDSIQAYKRLGARLTALIAKV